MESKYVDLDDMKFKKPFTIKDILELVAEKTGKNLEEFSEMEKQIRLVAGKTAICSEYAKFNEAMTNHAGLWLLFGIIIGISCPEEVIEWRKAQ